MNSVVRARAYELLGSLLVGERAAIAKVREVAPFADVLCGQHEAEIAAEHYSVFALEAFPYAGVFTEEQALVGGQISNRVAATLDALGDRSADRADEGLGNRNLLGDESPDHVGNILRVTGVLLRHNKNDAAVMLLRECLLPWLAPWVSAVSRQRGGFWLFVVETCLELLGEHLDGAEPARYMLADPLTVSASTGVNQIATALTIPAIAGAFLSREDIRNLGRTFELPTGFGSRQLMLTNLLRSAAEYQQGPALLTALSVFFDEEGEQIDCVSTETKGFSTVISSAWSARARQTSRALASMEVELAAAEATV